MPGQIYIPYLPVLQSISIILPVWGQFIQVKKIIWIFFITPVDKNIEKIKLFTYFRDDVT
jgi:hypothetical protein